MYFQHESMQLENYCTIPQINPNLSKYTSFNYSCKEASSSSFQVCLFFCFFFKNCALFMHKIEGNLGYFNENKKIRTISYLCMK